ncbi:MAG: cyclase family protein [bacterium]|nr:cyclase family protein [bacterium]
MTYRRRPAPRNSRPGRAGLVLALLVALPLGAAAAPDLADLTDADLVDLTHAFDTQTIYWPTARRFTLEPVAHGHTPGGWWYAANDFCAAEHGGTHLDAPIHFAEGGATADTVPLRRLIGPAAVVDLTARADADRDALLEVDDLEADERRHGAIPAGAIVLVRTGWAARWPDAARYLGTAVRGDTAGLHFPGVSEAAARWLVTARGVRAVGIDTASIDRGTSADFAAHRVLAAAGVPVFENLASLDRLPPRRAVVVALPMKIRDGSGGPLRALAILP